MDGAGIAKLPAAMAYIKDKAGDDMDPAKLPTDDVDVLTKVLGSYISNRRDQALT